MQANPFGRKGEEQPGAEEIIHDLKDITKVMPWSEEAEKGVLSSIMASPELLGDVRLIISPQDFRSEKVKTIYEEYLAFDASGKDLDPVKITISLREKGLLDRAGGASEITDIFGFIPVPSHWKYYTQIVKDKAELRRMADICATTLKEITDLGEKEPGKIRDKLEAAVTSMTIDRGHKGPQQARAELAGIVEGIEEAVMNPGRLLGLDSGYKTLNRMSQGLKPQEMFVIAARPSQGKTSLAMNLVENIAVDRENPVGIFSLEMSRQMLVRRLLGSLSGVSIKDMNEGKLNRSQQDAIARGIKKIQNAKIVIDETEAIDIAEFRSKARAMVRKDGVKMIMIDYLQLMQSADERKRGNREQEVAAISAGIKGAAKELNIPIIVLAQLNRSIDARKGGRPVLSDLRESGSIEQDADLIGFITSEEEEEEDSPIQKKMLVIAKNRNGETGDVLFNFKKTLMRFDERW